MAAVDYVEVSRQAHELAATYGTRQAISYADQQAELARAGEKPEDVAFWEAVADSLRPR
jgi:hypothetical protein